MSLSFTYAVDGRLDVFAVPHDEDELVLDVLPAVPGLGLGHRNVARQQGRVPRLVDHRAAQRLRGLLGGRGARVWREKEKTCLYFTCLGFREF